MNNLTLGQINFLKASLKKNYLFERNRVDDRHYDLVNRGYMRVLKCLMGPLGMIDDDTVGFALTEAGRQVVESWVIPS